MRAGNLDVIKFLVDKGVDINAKGRDGKTPLKFAETQTWAERYNAPLIEEFLKRNRQQQVQHELAKAPLCFGIAG